MKTQGGEMLHECNQCNYGLNQSRNLTAHMVTHSGVKYFKCSQCEFTHEGAQWRNVFNVQIVTFSFLRLTVGKNVPLQITSLAKCFVALTTFVQFLSGVSEEMPFHIGSR